MQKEERYTIVAVLAIAGIAGMCVNLFLALRFGSYSMLLAAISPPLIVVSIYYVIFKEDPTDKLNPKRARMWLLFLAAISCGIINVLAYELGLF